MDGDALFNQFLAKSENAELRKLLGQSGLTGQSNGQSAQGTTVAANTTPSLIGNVHNERRANIGLVSGIDSYHQISDMVQPKHVMLDEIVDSINVDGTTVSGQVELEWHQLPLSQDLLRGIQHKGFARPSRIQQIALPLILGGGRNVIAQAKNGSGKTATFALSMLSKVNTASPYVQAMCLCPTRELATQNVQVIQQLGQFTTIKTFLGIPQCQRYEVSLGCQLYVGTPGKTMDFIKKRIINTGETVLLVLDEADELINQENNMGPQVLQIRQQFKQAIQILLFSATFSDEVYKFANRVAPNAHLIQVKREQLTLDCIDQRYMLCNDEEDKYKKLSDIYGSMIVGQSVIFANSRDTAFKLSQRMRSEGHAVSLLCGSLGPQAGPNSMTPEIRDRIMKEFKDGETKVLVCTDVLSRGIDVPQVTLVINYELPFTYSGNRVSADRAICMETYLHRIGRTGRFGVKGMAINMITVNEMALIESIKSFYNCNVELLDCDPEALENIIKNYRA